MTATASRHDDQVALDRPMRTLADAGRQIKAERKALLHLLAVAERNVNRGLGGPDLAKAVARARAVRS